MSNAPSLSDIDNRRVSIPPYGPSGSEGRLGIAVPSSAAAHDSRIVVVLGSAAVMTAPVNITGSAKPNFSELAARWRENTSHLSRVQLMVADPNYLAIAAMGRAVVPLILQDLKQNGGYWYPLLEVLTEERPETSEERRTRAGMKVAWLRWGRGHGYIN